MEALRQPANPTWAWPTYPHTSPPAVSAVAAAAVPAAADQPSTTRYQLQHATSMANLHQLQAWRPPSPTDSNVSSSTSRSATPKNRRNPWATMSIHISTQHAGDSPQSPTPQFSSRSSTPVAAPQPIRPVVLTPSRSPTAPLSPQLLPAASVISPQHHQQQHQQQHQQYQQQQQPQPPQQSQPSHHHQQSQPKYQSQQQQRQQQDSPVRGSDYPTSPAPGGNPYRHSGNGSASSATAVNTPWPSLAFTYITPTLLTQFGRLYPDLLRRQGWPSSTTQMAIGWAISNPRTALLLLLCDDVQAWRKANIYGLEDRELPFDEVRLDNIAANPKRVVQTQWRVTLKELPQTGQHVEFQKADTLPLRQVTILQARADKTVDKVRWIGESDDRVYVRKFFTCSRRAPKESILRQVQEFRATDHPNIARLRCSYAKGITVGIITEAAQCNLDDFLQRTPDQGRAQLMLDWINDLTQALVYLHAKEDITHRSIKPHKILVDGSRVLFSAFGIAGDTDISNSFADARYIFAAPESISRGRIGKPADVFALGCVFLSMLTVVKSRSTTQFQAYRSAITHDPSFHANLDRVQSWRQKLQTDTTATSTIAQRQTEHHALAFVSPMLEGDSTKRVKIKKLAPYVSEWHKSRSMTRRRSLDALETPNRRRVDSAVAVMPAPQPPPLQAGTTDPYYSTPLRS